MTSTFARILSELSEPTAYVGYGGMGSHNHTPFHLASLADCYSPDGPDSPGAKFLAGIAESVAEYLTAGEGPNADAVASLGDAAHEIADGAVPIYTHERWATFVDLAAYQEDVTELGATTDDLTGAAGVALYMIAERLVRALADELAEALDADEPHACDRCGTVYDETTGDGYAGLCPTCADATEPADA